MNKTKTKNLYLENALKYKEKFGLDFIPLRITENGKQPNNVSWKDWQEKDQSFDEMRKLSWNQANGIGMINKKILTIDFDKCSDEKFIRNLIIELGGNYWLVKTGFGFHLHIRTPGLEYLEERLGKNGTIYLYPKDKTVLDHIELRIKNCYTAFPPSRHHSGANYFFIDFEPELIPDKVDAKKLLEVLEKYFIIDKIKPSEIVNKKLDNELSKIYAEGVEEGNRQNCLKRLFGVLHSRDIKRNMLETMLKEWNEKNRPPLTKKVFDYQFNDLIRRYDKGLDGIFLQFNNCLLQLKDDYKLKIEKIICFAVIEYDCDEKIIEELGLELKINEYHNECKKLVKHYEKWTGKKDQIVRIGKTLLLHTLNKKIRFDYFCIYVGILSYLGRNRNKPAQKISYSNIQYRAMGYKNENEFLRSGSTIRPYKLYTVRKAIEFLTEANFIRKFVLVKGQMIWFSTFITTYEELAEYVKNYELKKLKKERDKEEIRLRVLDEIRNEENELKDLKNKKKMNDPSSTTTSSSILLLSNEG